MEKNEGRKVVIRPMRWYAVPLPLAVLVFLPFASVRALQTGQSATQVVVPLALMVPAAAALVHWVWCFYVEIEGGTLRQQRFFGMGTRTWPVHRISRVGLKVVNNAMFLNVGLVQIHGPNDGLIQLQTSAYWPRDLRRLVTCLRSLDVPVSDDAIKALKIPRMVP